MNGKAKWYVWGVFSGVAIVLVAMTIHFGWLSPRQANATQSRAQPQSPDVQRFFKEAGEFIETQNRHIRKQESEAMESSLSSDLQTIRSQLELYQVQHLNKYPDAKAFTQSLLRRTNQKGEIIGNGGTVTDYPFGPYLASFPRNSFTNDRALSAVVKTGNGPCPGDGTTGWYFDASTNKFSPNDPAHAKW